MKQCALVALAISCLASVVNADATLEETRPFLKQHCYSCHGAEKQKADYRFDNLANDLSRVENLEVWQTVLDVMNRGEMPPRKQPQPKLAETEPVIEIITSALRTAYANQQSTGGQTVIRRLNRHELRNTLRDLFYLQGYAYRPDMAAATLFDNNGNGKIERTGIDPVRFFPEDENDEGFFNIGDKLVMSDFLLKLMLEAGEETINAATHVGPKPNVQTRAISGHFMSGRSNGEHPIEFASREVNSDYNLMMKGYERFGRLSPQALRNGVGVAGRYRITVEASAHHQEHAWGELIKTDQSQPLQLSLNKSDARRGGLAGVTSTWLASWSLPDDGVKRSYSFETWMDPTWTPWLGWENGPVDRGLRAETLVEKYLPDVFTPRPDKKTDKKAHDQWPMDMAKAVVKHGYQGPHIRIYGMTVEPLIDTWPPKSHTALYGTGSSDRADIERLLTNFAERAFRRPVTSGEVAPYVELVMSQIRQPEVASLGSIQDARYRVYEGDWHRLPDFDKLTPVAEGKFANGRFDITVSTRREKYAITGYGTIKAPVEGTYEFQMASDDGARISIDGKTVIIHDGLHGGQLKKGTIELTPGEHDIRIDYLAYGVPNSFRAGWRGPGFELADLSAMPMNQSSQARGQAPAKTSGVMRAMQDGYLAILCSPQFVYLKESGDQLSAYELASRMSYFLWSSMPDDQLFRLAKSGELLDSQIRERQVERMLKDEKAKAFIRHFVSAWLRLDKLGKMPPSGNEFAFYRNLKVEPLMIKQITTYFAEILEGNKSIELFIDSDYVYMNGTLAKWIYKREDITGERLRKVKLNDRRHGGIFTHPGLMTATANGVDTSPVIRGVWVLENVLGTPPSPPPPDVEPLPTDTRAATTIREQLELHRKHDACNGCHRKIDPMGFAFENFDPVGRWRDRYKRAKEPIDASATMADGSHVADIVQFKQMLLARKDLVAGCLAEKMLVYATGRKLEAGDRGELDRIVGELAKRGNRLRDLVHMVVQSKIFLNK